ncbi:MAG: phenylalanine--tRNA ligase subunit alpha [Candidatus Omnitrophica bacterium]|nr:phenylalanine--tRNA ligase subunit alpha [Candidatus Omnitrophota bacterium]MDD5672249.1 phenylalanine--tRNA ligase subunit alpha [Candidatus Omnitrophota bacterium]
MSETIDQVEEQAKLKLDTLRTPEELASFRIAYLGKKGKLAALMEKIKTLPIEEKREFGGRVNQLKNYLEKSFEAKSELLHRVQKKPEFFDETLPAIYPRLGRLHPITQTIREISQIFERLGFDVVDGPEIETEYYNFTALNIPLDHPSRDAFDTFYTEGGQLLRSQTSTVQIRVMQTKKPPLRIIAPGRVYRPDTVDASHSFMFHQIEGLMVDDKTTFSDLKGVLHLFLRELFGSEVKIRFRPHFFPFTEPSVEVDLRWGSRGWLEILGAGSVDPNVFDAVGYNSKQVQGFAFGLGVERIAMLRHGIEDIRLFYENDIRFLRQF